MVIITIIIMAITMGTVHNIVLSQMARGTCQKSCVTSAETKDTTPINAQKRRMGHQIHSRDNLRGLKIIWCHHLKKRKNPPWSIHPIRRLMRALLSVVLIPCSQCNKRESSMRSVFFIVINCLKETITIAMFEPWRMFPLVPYWNTNHPTEEWLGLKILFFCVKEQSHPWPSKLYPKKQQVNQQVRIERWYQSCMNYGDLG